ncbi:MAG: HNH endonuclease [Euryarchaeota archaeon]|nr:HNH endonuclease [Euryarchaeota archaeon]
MAVNISIYDENGKFAKQVKHYVHRLVAEAFIPNPENLSDVDHIDCIKDNNDVSNLRWVSRDDNMARNRLPNGTICKRGSYYIMEDGNWILIPKKDHAKYGIIHETTKTSN